MNFDAHLLSIHETGKLGQGVRAVTSDSRRVSSRPRSPWRVQHEIGIHAIKHVVRLELN